MTKNAKIKGPLCGASASGGTLVCVLALGHAKAAHASSSDRKPAQHATWTVDGAKVTVKAFSHGKQMSEWTEDAPVARVDDGDDRPAWLIKQTAERDAAGRGKPMTAEQKLADPNSGGVLLEDLVAEREAKAKKKAAKSAPVEESEPAEEVEDEPDDIDMRNLARQQREAREAHAAAVGFAPPEDGDAPAVDRDLKPDNMIAPTGEFITCRGKVYRVHPEARRFETPEAQYREILESMRRDGQKQDIEILADTGEVIDGCTRLRICDELNIEPRTKIVHVEPGRHRRYVIAVNVARRHMDESMRAIAAADLATVKVGTNQHTRGSANLPTLEEEITQAEAAEMLSVSPKSVSNAARVKNAGTPELEAAMRSQRLKVSAAAELAKLGPAKQREFVEKLTKGNGEVRAGKVRALVRQEQKRETIERINTGRVAPMPMGPFGVIYGDYPWWYENSDQHEGSRGHMGYPPMKMPEILAHGREAAKRAADDCVIALWVTNAYVHEIGNVLAAYGATQRTMITWDKATKNDKDKKGMGSWPRGRTEHLVIASIGKPTHTLNDVDTLIRAAVREHSRKPDIFAEILAKNCGGPHLELFGREPREGWEVWGAETDGSVFDKTPTVEAPPKKRSKILTVSDERARAL